LENQALDVNGAKNATLVEEAPDLQETCRGIRKIADGILSGEVKLDVARALVPYKRMDMKRFDFVIQAARMNPAYRAELARLLSLPEPKQPMEPKQPKQPAIAPAPTAEETRPAAGSSAPMNLIQRLDELEALKERGILTQAEFERKKGELRELR
jgi:hypothetical protein